MDDGCMCIILSPYKYYYLLFVMYFSSPTCLFHPSEKHISFDVGFFNLLTWWVYDISQWLKSGSTDDDFFLISSTAGLTVHQIKGTCHKAYSFRFPEIFTCFSSEWSGKMLIFTGISIGVTFLKKMMSTFASLAGRRWLHLFAALEPENTGVHVCRVQCNLFFLKKHGLDMAGSPFRTVVNPSKCVP